MTERRTGRAVSALILCSALWGGTFVAIRDTVAHLAPLDLVFTRFAAAVALFALLLVARKHRPGRPELVGGLLSGLCAAAGFQFQAVGLTATSAGTSAFLTSIGTLLAGLFAWPLLGQRPGAILASGLGLAALGSALLPARAELRLGPGELWTLAGAVAFGVQVVALARFAPRADPLGLASIQAATVAVVLAGFGARLPAETLDRDALLRVAYLVVAGSVVAPFLQVTAQRVLPAARVALLLALEPVFALVFALTLGAERFPARWFAGAALILTSVILVEASAAVRASASRPATG